MISAGQLISERVMLKRDRFFTVSARDGSIRPGEFAGDGLWDGDTRILSRFRVLVDGLEPRAIGLHADDSAATFEYSAGALHVTRVRFIDAGLHERITLTNPGDTMVDAVLEIEVAADFAAMLGIRGAVPSLADPTEAEATKTVDGVRFTASHGSATRSSARSSCCTSTRSSRAACCATWPSTRARRSTGTPTSSPARSSTRSAPARWWTAACGRTSFMEPSTPQRSFYARSRRPSIGRATTSSPTSCGQPRRPRSSGAGDTATRMATATSSTPAGTRATRAGRTRTTR